MRAGDFNGTDYFTRDADGRLVGRRRYNADGSFHERDFYLFDALGSVVAVVKGSNGAVDKRYTYDPYGTTTVSGSANQLIGDSNPFHFTGEYQDRQTGLYKIGHRYLQPDLGRWTQRDPLQHRINPTQPAEHNPYAYVGCNPINYIDPTGAISFECIASVVTAVLGVAMTVMYAPATLSALFLAGALGVSIGAGISIGFACLT